MKQKLIELKEEIDSSTVLVGDLSAPLWIMGRTTRQKISKEIEDLNNTLNQLCLTDIQNTLPNNNSTHILLKCMWDIFQNRPYIRP